MIPHKCPVCEGRGKMLATFYGESTNEMSGLVNCKSCYGTGIIWDFSTTPYVPYIQPTITPIHPINPQYPINPIDPPYYTTCHSNKAQLVA